MINERAIEAGVAALTNIANLPQGYCAEDMVRAVIEAVIPLHQHPATAIENAYLEGYIDGRRGASRHQNDREYATSESAWKISDTRASLNVVEGNDGK